MLTEANAKVTIIAIVLLRTSMLKRILKKAESKKSQIPCTVSIPENLHSFHINVDVLGFYISKNNFKSYWDNGRMVFNGSVQWSAISKNLLLVELEPEFTVRSSECLPLGHHVMKDVAQVANTILVLAVSLTEILSLKGT